MREQDLFDKLRKIERLYAGATTHGEKEAAAEAIARIKRRLGEAAKVDHPIEYKFTLVDGWSRKLFIALLRRYSLKPYRRARQRRNTVMVKVPRSFVEETLWPEFIELSDVLQAYLDEVTQRVISQGIHADESEEEIVAEDCLG
ncbi:MAG: hypothetical protein NTX35_02755 [Verrucomicrobia bacterium]|jgi:hypothetical protein|nr:hypothetical protein [Verrucomicrobiota bacterium]